MDSEERLLHVCSKLGRSKEEGIQTCVTGETAHLLPSPVRGLNKYLRTCTVQPARGVCDSSLLSCMSWK